jgi:hypothetical protein
LHPGGTIDFAGVNANGDNYSGGVLTLDNGTTPVVQLALSFGGSGVGAAAASAILECGHHGARASPASPHARSTGLRNSGLGLC